MGSKLTLALWGFGVAIAFVPGMYAAPFLPRWWAICLGLVSVPSLNALALDERVLWIMGPMMIWAALTLLWTPGLFGGAFLLFCLALFCVVAVASANLKQSPRDVMFASFGWGIAVSCVLAVPQFFGHSPVPQMMPPGGLFYNPEVFAEAAALAFVWALFAQRFVLAAVLALGIALCHEHIATFIAVAALVWFFVRSPQWRALVLSTIVMVGIVSLTTRLGSAETRIVYWWTAIYSLSFSGAGLGWWFQAHPFPFEEYVHSDLLQSGVELGLAALAWPLAFGFAFRGSAATRAEKALLMACILEFTVSFPLHMPATLFVSAVAAGAVACRHADVCVAQLSGRNLDADAVRWPGSFGRRLSERVAGSRAALSVRSALAQFAVVHRSADFRSSEETI